MSLKRSLTLDSQCTTEKQDNEPQAKQRKSNSLSGFNLPNQKEQGSIKILSHEYSQCTTQKQDDVVLRENNSYVVNLPMQKEQESIANCLVKDDLADYERFMQINNLEKLKQEEALVQTVLDYFIHKMNKDAENFDIVDKKSNEAHPEDKEWHAQKVSGGRGGFGTVLKLTRRSTKSKEIDLTRAIKVILNQKIGLSEAIKAAKLNHPNVVKIYNVLIIRFLCCIEMEFIEHGSLLSLMKSKTKLQSQTIFNMLYQSCETLLYFKQQNIVHSDIKPGNIMVKCAQNFDIVICDFGLALQKETFSEQVMGGTKRYYAPELQNKSKEEFNPTFHSDLYSLGVTFSELCSSCFEQSDPDYIKILHICHKFKSPSVSEREDVFYHFSLDMIKNNKRTTSTWENDEKMLSLILDNSVKVVPFKVGELPSRNKEFILKYKLFDHADKSLTGIREFMLKSIEHNERTFLFVEEALADDESFLLDAIFLNSKVLIYFKESYKSNTDFIRKALERNLSALKYSDSSIRGDKNEMLEVITKYEDSLQFVENSLQKDRNFIMEVMKRNGKALEHADSIFQKDQNIVMEAVKQNGYALAFADISLRKNRRIVKLAVSQNGGSIKYADKFFRKDKEIISIAFKQRGEYVLNYIDNSLLLEMATKTLL